MFGFVRNKQGKILDEKQKQQTDGDGEQDDDLQSISDNVSAAGSDSSFFDPPIEYFRANNGMTYGMGMNSGETSNGMVLNATNHLNASNGDSHTDFDKSFANREGQLTPEHTPLKIKTVSSTLLSVGNSQERLANRNSINNASTDMEEPDKDLAR